MSLTGLIFVDADAFVALYNPKDTQHEKAKKCLDYIEQQGLKLATSELVLIEAATVLTMRAKNLTKKTIAKIFQDIRDSDYTIFSPDNTIFEKGLERFYQQTSKKIGAFDCCHMCQMEKAGINVIFSFDAGYKKNGFSRLYELVN